MSNTNQHKAELKKWIAAKNSDIEVSDIADDREILADKLLTSLQVMELVLFLEQLNGSPVDTDKLGPGAFKTVNTIVENFLS